jgi:hypothetical protein
MQMIDKDYYFEDKHRFRNWLQVQIKPLGRTNLLRTSNK